MYPCLQLLCDVGLNAGQGMVSLNEHLLLLVEHPKHVLACVDIWNLAAGTDRKQSVLQQQQQRCQVVDQKSIMWAVADFYCLGQELTCLTLEDVCWSANIM